MSGTKLMRLVSSPQKGWEDLVGTFWVLQSNGKTLRHVTPRQAEIKVTMRSREDVAKHFRPAGESP